MKLFPHAGTVFRSREFSLDALPCSCYGAGVAHSSGARTAPAHLRSPSLQVTSPGMPVFRPGEPMLSRSGAVFSTESGATGIRTFRTESLLATPSVQLAVQKGGDRS